MLSLRQRKQSTFLEEVEEEEEVSDRTPCTIYVSCTFVS